MREYQENSTEFIKRNMNCAVWMDLGLGKTVTTLTAISDLMRSFDASRVLLIAPLRVARKVWTDEVKEWSHVSDLRVSVMCGSVAERLAAMRAEADIYCINRENVAWLCQQFVIRDNGRLKQIAKWPWDTVILDESDSFKSQSSERWKWMKRVRRLFPRMIQLTGTPTPNGYADLWSQIYLLDGGKRLGSTESAFKERFMDPPGFGQMRWTMKPHSEKHIKDLLADIVISLRAEDYLDLPPILHNHIRVELPKEALKHIEKLERMFITEIVPEKKVTAANGGVLYGKLLQMAGGAVYRQVNETIRETIPLHDEKIKALLELIELTPGPVMVAYSFQHEQERIEKALVPWCAKHQKTVRRLKTVVDENDWNAGKVDVLLLHPASGGHGLNLQFSGSENIIWFGPTPNRGHYDQLNARLAGGHRRVGKNIVIHHILAEDTIDIWDTLPLLENKGEAQERLLRLLADKVQAVSS